MCVITICRSLRETEENLKAMEEANKDGTGIIFYENGVPHYKKNIKIEEAIELNKSLPFPYAFHFRYATIGKDKLLTHPFEVTEDCKLKTEGSAPTLLMHNGHWNNWDDTLLNLSVNTLKDLPDGDWSDSRAMAYMAAEIGPNILRAISGQKIAIFKEGEKIQLIGNGWDIEEGIAYSNKTWEYKLKKNQTYAGYLYNDGYTQRIGQPETWRDRRNEKKHGKSEPWLTEEDKRALRALQVGYDKTEKGGK